MASNNLIISTLFIYLTTYASLYFAVGKELYGRLICFDDSDLMGRVWRICLIITEGAAAARDGDENKIDYGNEEFGSGSSARIDEENLPEMLVWLILWWWL